MKDFFKDITSLVIALAILMGILFLPDIKLQKLNQLLRFISRSQETALALGKYLIQRVETAVIVLIISLILGLIAQSHYLKQK
jgi:hypothetical protein